MAERMARQHLRLDAPLRADQHGLDIGSRLTQRLRECERGHEMAAGATSGE